jgi:hypothetical protein
VLEHCASHPRRGAVTRCASCRRQLCADCWRRKVDSEPWCEQCIHLLSSAGGNVALAVAFFLSAMAVAFWGVHWELGRGERPSLIWALIVIGAVVGALYVSTGKPSVADRQIHSREPHEVSSPPRAAQRGHPYRVALRRVSNVVASPVSGVKTAVLVMLSMLLVALALPGLLHLPRLVEFEIVLAAFWLLWGSLGTLLLYRGFRIAHDHVLSRPRAPWQFWESNEKREASRDGDDGRGFGWLGCIDVYFIVPLTILTLAFMAAWLMVEVVIPVLFFLAYLAVRSALAAIANDEHHCQGHVGRALAWGFGWSSVYILPLAGTLALIHWLAH